MFHVLQSILKNNAIWGLFRSRRYHGTQQLNDSCQPGIHQFKVKMKHVWCKFVQNTVKCFQVWCLIHQAQLFIYVTVHWQVEPQIKSQNQKYHYIAKQHYSNWAKASKYLQSHTTLFLQLSYLKTLATLSLRSAYTACFSKKGFHK